MFSVYVCGLLVLYFNGLVFWSLMFRSMLSEIAPLEILAQLLEVDDSSIILISLFVMIVLWPIFLPVLTQTYIDINSGPKPR